MEYALVGAPLAAGTDGTVQVEELEGGNRLVTISVDYLPPPARLGDGLTTYVVWFVPNGQPAVKAGSLDYDPDNRQGRMHATTPLHRFRLKLTAEESGAVAAPSDVVVVNRIIGSEE